MQTINSGSPIAMFYIGISILAFGILFFAIGIGMHLHYKKIQSQDLMYLPAKVINIQRERLSVTSDVDNSSDSYFPVSNISMPKVQNKPKVLLDSRKTHIRLVKSSTYM